MLSKNLFRISPYTTNLPKYLPSWYCRSFSNRENEALARMIKSKENNGQEISKEEKKSRGFNAVYMGKGVDAMVEKRRRQSSYLEIQKKKKESIPQYFESPGEVTVDFMLYMEHFDQESNLIDAVLNYYEIAYKKNDNLLYLDNFRSVHAKDIPNLQFPIMKVHVGLEPEVLLKGYKEIENYLIKSHFILQPLHSQNSAWAAQSIDFVKNTVKPNLDMLFWNPILTYENMFKGAPSTYRGNFRNYMLIRALRLLAQNVAVNIFRNYGKLLKNRAEYKKSREMVLKNFEEWIQRLDGKLFHGGEEPDEADFEMYAAVKSKHNSRSFRNFLEYKCPDKFYRWFVRMQLKCVYDEERVNFIE